MHQTKIAAFLNQKGGVGKTTSVINIGAGLAILGKKVLMVDLDPQGHLTTFLGIETDESTATIYDVLRGKAETRDALIKQELGARINVGGEDSRLAMTVLPSSSELGEAEMSLSLLPDREFLLQAVLRELRGEFDYILIDCPPSLGLLSTNALTTADKVYVPVQTEFLALDSLENLLKKIEIVMEKANPELEIGGLIATRYDGRKLLNRAVVESMRERFGLMFLETMIRENIVLAESPRYGKDIFSYRPRSNGAADYLKLCTEIMGRVTTSDELFKVERGGKISTTPEAGESSLDIAGANA